MLIGVEEIFKHTYSLNEWSLSLKLWWLTLNSHDHFQDQVTFERTNFPTTNVLFLPALRHFKWVKLWLYNLFSLQTLFVHKGSCRVQLENYNLNLNLGSGGSCYIPKGKLICKQLWVEVTGFLIFPGLKYTISNPGRSHLVIMYLKY